MRRQRSIVWCTESNGANRQMVKIRAAALTHWAVTQGPVPAGGGGLAQPAIRWGAACVTTGCPMTVTRGTGAEGCACPPCTHMTVAPT